MLVHRRKNGPSDGGPRSPRRFGFSRGAWLDILFLQEMCVTIGIWPWMHDVVCAEQLIREARPSRNAIFLSVWALDNESIVEFVS
jgi:hypothetical protein